VPNNAIVQGNVRITKDISSRHLQLPFVEGEYVEVTEASKKYDGIAKITTNFTTLYNSESENEIILSNNSIISGQFIIIKKGSSKKVIHRNNSI